MVAAAAAVGYDDDDGVGRVEGDDLNRSVHLGISR